MRLPGEQLVLDTNILLHVFRGGPPGQLLNTAYGLTTRVPKPVISVVTKAEMMSLAVQLGWGAQRVQALDGLLRAVPTLDVLSSAQPLLAAYAWLDAYGVSIGRKMGKNDAWIAATAHALGATVLTTDQDFVHLNPQFVKVEYVDPAGLLAGRI